MPSSPYIPQEMLACLKRYWGYTRFRPWQEETILAILDDQESLTILPTGGGKSLCFQLPALLKEGMAVVISPQRHGLPQTLHPRRILPGLWISLSALKIPLL
jgi:superfamily II DNA/RNA helicase